jgi:hypothetical protein
MVHPSGIGAVFRAGWRMRRRQWWTRVPFLPLPDESYWDFRISTVAGRDGDLDPEAIVAAAKWSLQQRSGR